MLLDEIRTLLARHARADLRTAVDGVLIFRADQPAPPGDIAGISRRVGYQSPSQFTREYRRQFGAPPSQDDFRSAKADWPHRTA